MNEGDFYGAVYLVKAPFVCFIKEYADETGESMYDRSFKMEMQKEKILVFSSREICYLSSNFFANQIGAAFEELGYDVEICEMSKEDDLDEKLEPYIGHRYRLILDFNSTLPRMVLEDGTPYLEKLDGPFFDYIVDHPLFHYNGLSSGVQNMHALVLDEAQNRYVRQYYPKIVSVHTVPLGATKALYEGEKENECRILFPGTYDSPDAVYGIIKEAPALLREMADDLIARRLADPLQPMEDAFAAYLAEHDMELLPDQFAVFMNALYAVDAYVRDYFRKIALDELLRCGIPVTVKGEGWEKYHYKDEHSLVREAAVPFALSFERIAKAHILLDVSPIFNRGMHDRIPAGMANRAVVLTDGNPYLEKELTDGTHAVFYSLADIRSLSGQAERLIAERSLRGEIAERAYEKYEKCYTWKCRAQEILQFVR